MSGGTPTKILPVSSERICKTTLTSTGSGATAPLTFTDADGDQYRVTLSQPGSLTVIIDASIAELMSVSEYRRRYWPEIAIIVAPPSEVDRMGLASFAAPSARNILALDFHAEHDGPPYLTVETIDE